MPTHTVPPQDTWVIRNGAGEPLMVAEVHEPPEVFGVEFRFHFRVMCRSFYLI